MTLAAGVMSLDGKPLLLGWSVLMKGREQAYLVRRGAGAGVGIRRWEIVDWVFEPIDLIRAIEVAWCAVAESQVRERGVSFSAVFRP